MAVAPGCVIGVWFYGVVNYRLYADEAPHAAVLLVGLAAFRET